jgi:hypothetical protein
MIECAETEGRVGGQGAPGGESPGTERPERLAASRKSGRAQEHDTFIARFTVSTSSGLFAHEDHAAVKLVQFALAVQRKIRGNKTLGAVKLTLTALDLPARGAGHLA